VDFDKIDTRTVHRLPVDFEMAHRSGKRQVLYNNLIEFVIPTKLDGLIKMCLSQIYSNIRL
jgi:hypothetical protein